MSSRFQIRDYQEEDEAHLIRLIQELQGYETNYYDRMIPPDDIAGWYVDAIKKDCRDYAGQIRFAWLAGAPVGYCAILTRVPNEEADEKPFDYAYVSEIVIAETARGQGIGKALLQDAEAIARAAQAKWLRISVLAQNSVARELYDRFGFAEHVVTMEKPLR